MTVHSNTIKHIQRML